MQCYMPRITVPLVCMHYTEEMYGLITANKLVVQKILRFAFGSYEHAFKT